MKLKPGVKLGGISPEMAVAAVVIESVIPGAVITSALDGKHSTNSLHYKGRAFDVRSKTISDKPSVLAFLKAALGAEFDVILEGEGTDNEHLHVEWDPKE